MHEGAAGSRPALPPAALAPAWVAEHRAQWRRQPEPLVDLPSGRDVAALDAAGREAMLCALLQKVAAGAWQRLPDVGARAVSVGGLVLRMSVGLGGSARQRVAALADARGAPKQLKQAVQRALKDPLSRRAGAAAGKAAARSAWAAT